MSTPQRRPAPSQASTADLELSVAPLGQGWGVSLRLSAPDKRDGPFPIQLDVEALRALELDAADYGAALRDALFAAPEARTAFRECRAAVLRAGQRLRVRLLLPPELHTLRWERLLDPYSERALGLDDNLLLSRYLSADDYTPVQLRPKGHLRALIAVAAPLDYEDHGLARIDADAETRRAQAALAEIETTAIAGTWDALRESLDQDYDILYLVAHGVIQREQPWLWLVDDQDNADRRRGGALADWLRGLGERRPRLVVLASCESAGDGHADTLAALGPQLARAGIPAVLAMQGKQSIATNERFAAAFFRELLVDGLIDRAVNKARLAVEDRPDWWVPILYTRLEDGRLWREEAPTPTPAGGISIGGNVDTMQVVTVTGGNIGSIIGSQHNYGTPPAAASGRAEAITTQRQRLQQHRATLAHYLGQLAITGAANARPEVTAGIREARAGIARAKAALVALGETVEDLPDDTP